MRDKRKILVVDDDPFNRKLAVRALSDAGYQTLAAMDGTEGLAMALREKPDAVLTDFSMPEMDGYKLAEGLIFAGYKGKRVLMSGNRDEAYERYPSLRDFFDAYFDGFIKKPFTPTLLVKEFRRVLGEQ